MLNDTIVGISTPLAKGAISIIRISGDDAFDIAKDILHIKKIIPNTITYHHIYENDEIIDEVLVSFFKGPKSYTREDMVEINCHGGIYITRKIYNLLLSKGLRGSEPGEFTKRAYLNGRIDLAKAEASNDLINAHNEFQAKSALRALEGSVERLLLPMMEEMRDIISNIEVNIDYPEYEDEVEITNNIIKPYLDNWINESQKMIDEAERFRIIKDGIKTVIIGKPNVGKSSLLNALLQKDKAIVTDIAGTTRDLVEGRAILDNVTLELIDTAGIREGKDEIEKIGINKSIKAMDEADLILLVLDSNNIDEEDERLLKLTENHNRVVVYNKKDICEAGEIAISAKYNDIDALKNYLNEKYKDDINLIDEDILNNERQISLMKQSLNALKEVRNNIDITNLDVIQIDLERAYQFLSDILGRDYQEDLIDHMFKNFCLGK